MRLGRMRMKTQPVLLALDPSPEQLNRARIAELQTRDRLLTEEMIRLEKSQVGPSDQSREIDARARSLISGQPAEVLPTHDLGTVRLERETVRRAIKLLSDEVAAVVAEQQRQAVAERMDEWRGLIRKSVLAVVELQRLNRAREKFKKELGLPCNMAPNLLLGTGEIVGDAAYRFVQDVIRAGIVTESEVRLDD